MPVARKFDWEAAQRLRAEGRSYLSIAREFGVSQSAVMYACDPVQRRRARENSSRFQRSGTCIDCGGPCSRNTTLGILRCRDCAAKVQVTSVREHELQCATCQEWKPDTGFPRNRSEGVLRRYRHHQCTACGTKQKRAWRAKQKAAA